MSDVKNWKEKWGKFDAIKFVFAESAKRAHGLKVLSMSTDAAICLLKYGATFHDYFNLRLYKRNKIEREAFLTTKMVQNEKRSWDKSQIDSVDNKKKFNILFPEVIHRKWIDMDEADFETFKKFVDEKGEFFIKPKRESSGIGIGRFLTTDIKDLKSFYEEKSNIGVLCEETVHIYDKLRELNPHSVSQVRIVTVLGKSNEVNILASTLRTGGSKTVGFNTAKYDIFSQINIDTGICFTEGIDESGIEYKAHPVSGVEFVGFEIPEWKTMIDTCKKLALRVTGVRVIGWDVSLTENGEVVIFEGNPGSGVASMQIADGIGKKELFYKYLES